MTETTTPIIKKTIKRRARTTISEKVDAKPILPGSDGWSVIETGRGRRHNHVSEALNEMLQIAVSRGHLMFQLEVDKPFTITQVRYWAKNRNNATDSATQIGDLARQFTSNAEVRGLVMEANHIQVGINEEAAKIQIQLVNRNKK